MEGEEGRRDRESATDGERERLRDRDKTMEMDKDRKKTWGGGDTLTEMIIISRRLDNFFPQMGQ